MTNQSAPARIVVGVDGSEQSIGALRVAQHLAAAMDAEIGATGCWEYVNMRSARITLGAMGEKEEAKAELEAAIEAAIGASLPKNFTVDLVFGPAERRLVEASKTAQMLVVGRRGHGGLNGLLVGSVSSSCVRRAKCPVLVVHEPMGERGSASVESEGQALERQLDSGRIVVGVDGSPQSVHALREGARIASALGGVVDAVACWEFPSIWAAPYPLAGEDFQGEAVQALTSSLDEAFGVDRPKNVSSRLVQAQVRPGLIEASKDAAMLVLGRRGRGLARLGLGSVSAGCVSHASCPVLVVNTEPDD